MLQRYGDAPPDGIRAVRELLSIIYHQDVLAVNLIVQGVEELADAEV
jgi:hypothetical protein